MDSSENKGWFNKSNMSNIGMGNVSVGDINMGDVHKTGKIRDIGDGKVDRIFVISDLHCGDGLGLIGKDGVRLDTGMYANPSELQLHMYDVYDYCVNTWLPEAADGKKFVVVVNGDIMDGVHHGSLTAISNNQNDQIRIAKKLLLPLYDMCDGRMYFIRGTEAHSGKSGKWEEVLGEEMNVVRDNMGRYSRYELLVRLAGRVVHFSHHISATGSSAYETTALNRELSEFFTQAERWGYEAPEVIIRSHRHISNEIRIPTFKGHAICAVTPGFQATTPFGWKLMGARAAYPQFGGMMVVAGDRMPYVLSYIVNVKRADEIEL